VVGGEGGERRKGWKKKEFVSYTPTFECFRRQPPSGAKEKREKGEARSEKKEAGKGKREGERRERSWRRRLSELAEPATRKKRKVLKETSKKREGKEKRRL